MPPPDLETIRALEEELHKQSVRRSRDAVDGLLLDTFFEFGRSGGVYDKAEIICSLAGETAGANETLSATDYKFMPLSDDVVLLTYRTERVGPKCQLRTLRSSIWKLDNGRWRMAFHQGTPTGE